MNELRKDSVNWLAIDERSSGQRIDNFLLRMLKGVPKSHIYRILRSGEVRVNSKRVAATARLVTGDRVRVPPVQLAQRQQAPHPIAVKRQLPILYEDDYLLAIDKPAGWAVHGGSGVSLGIIEQLRAQRPQSKFLELVHRLDRETSGVLLLAKKRTALLELHRQLREGEMLKCYQTLVKGCFPKKRQEIQLALHKFVTKEGERRVRVQVTGSPAHTIFNRLKVFAEMTLLEAELKTGRTHQIRVHLAHIGFPIVGDDKYGDFAWNKEQARRGMKRMFLHAAQLRLRHPMTEEDLVLNAPLTSELAEFLKHVENE